MGVMLSYMAYVARIPREYNCQSAPKSSDKIRSEEEDPLLRCIAVKGYQQCCTCEILFRGYAGCKSNVRYGPRIVGTRLKQMGSILSRCTQICQNDQQTVW